MVFPIFLLSDLYLFIPAVIIKIFNPTAELAVPTRTPTNELNTETGTQLLTAEIKQENERNNS